MNGVFAIADRPILITEDAALETIEMHGDPSASAVLKRQLARVLLNRAMAQREGSGA